MPSDLILCNANVLPVREDSVSEFVADQQERFRSAYQVARDHLRAAAQKRKAYYDATVRAKQFSVGDKVWYFYPRKYVKRSRKWSFMYVGPYEIIQKLSELTYAIRKTPRDKPIVVHIDKLKKCVINDIHLNVAKVNNKTVSVDSQVTTFSSMDRQEPASCDLCDRVFTRKSDLNRHRQDVHVKTVCEYCDAVLGSRRAWKKHARNFHGEASSRFSKPATATTTTSRTSQKLEDVARRVCWDNPSDQNCITNMTSYVPVLRTSTESDEGKLPTPNLVPPPNSVVTVPKETIRPRLVDFVPNGVDRKQYNDRMEIWSRRIARENRVLDEQDWLREVQKNDPNLGFLGRQTVFHMLRLHNQMLSLGSPARTKKSTEGSVIDKKGQKKSGKNCTESRSIKKPTHQPRTLPKRVSATITRPLTIEEEPKRQEALSDGEMEMPELSPAMRYDEKTTTAKFEELVEVTGVTNTDRSKVKADIMWAECLSESPSSLIDASTMQFSALCHPVITSDVIASGVDTTASQIFSSKDLEAEVSSFLRSSNEVKDDCFTFDLESINEVCSYEI